MQTYSLVFLDIDGTLLDSMGMWRTLGSTLAQNHGAVPPPGLDLRVASLGLWEGTAYCKEACGLPGTVEELVQEIIIGPESTQSKPIMQDYLRDNGLKELAERVSLSQCPLRRSLS